MGDSQQGLALLWAMGIIFTIAFVIVVYAEMQSNPQLMLSGTNSNINLEGKENRFGILNSALFAEAGRSAILNPGTHALSEVLYAFSSAANNNGSAFAGLNSNNLFYNITLSIVMFLGRFGLIKAVIATAGIMVRKKHQPENFATLPTHGPLFIGLLILTVFIIGALTFVPALALGPIAEHLQIWHTS